MCLLPMMLIRAGQAATVRGLDLAVTAGCQVRVLALPAGKDPDDVIRSDGAQTFAALIDKALPIPMYYFQRLLERHDTSNLEGRLAVAEAMVPSLGKV